MYRVPGAVPNIEPAHPYITIDSSNGHLATIAAFDFAHISIEEEFDAYVDFSVYTFRKASDFHGGYDCE